MAIDETALRREGLEMAVEIVVHSLNRSCVDDVNEVLFPFLAICVGVHVKAGRPSGVSLDA